MLRSVSILRTVARSPITTVVSRYTAPHVRALTTQSSDTKGSSSSGGSNGSSFMWLALGGLVAGSGYYYYTTQDGCAISSKFAQKPLDYQAVYNAIAEVMDENDYDDGSYGPVLLRLAWHASGTYDKNTGTGGSNGATMRFNPESAHGANAGLSHARERLEKVKKQFPSITYADLWSLAGVVAVQEMGGPDIPWRAGRKDAETSVACTPDGRLPDASQSHDHLRNIFYRMGFNDQEIVALSGAHSLGRCHTDRSGYDGPWSFSPTTFSNAYFKLLFSEKWVDKKWTGPKQAIDKATGTLMMLPTDLAITNDRVFKKQAEIYAKDEGKFFEDFAKAFQKLEELGVPFKPDTPAHVFKRI
ncbi:hypothetical protein BATDEDRAFT_9339 [Batrachochytrium dendrobatidis JAM81]|uniref:Peroxidase n=1 Tax=Batrachochytrium dendrobatidis (strain JAM81 / FGSC 10211) TaxID=684364 RepID=F4NWR7_BATDJ|nr:uncharacterized protein BATDEDRAFT_9339 [Batrachochytrium dendrobatidis JAM81]EGF82871.1 hypothetical protein BATDEDRAFT_9339 [Batrachochytrium dendrobatidis JAM81]|eukprot:XP_006676497.1 hypothetical protein BATDEDRAFT_9339 [Batrachochytrium dendrobatidis JAM81]